MIPDIDNVYSHDPFNQGTPYSPQHNAKQWRPQSLLLGANARTTITVGFIPDMWIVAIGNVAAVRVSVVPGMDISGDMLLAGGGGGGNVPPNSEAITIRNETANAVWITIIATFGFHISPSWDMGDIV